MAAHAGRVHWSSMKGAIAALDSTAFASEYDVRTVLQCMPTEEEASLLASYLQTGANRETLSDAELFCNDLMQVCLVRWQSLRGVLFFIKWHSAWA